MVDERHAALLEEGANVLDRIGADQRQGWSAGYGLEEWPHLRVSQQVGQRLWLVDLDQRRLDERILPPILRPPPDSAVVSAGNDPVWSRSRIVRMSPAESPAFAPSRRLSELKRIAASSSSANERSGRRSKMLGRR